MHFSALNVIQHPLELSPSLDALAAFAFFNVDIKNGHTPTLGAFSQIVFLPVQTIPLYLTLTADADIDNTRFALFRIIHISSYCRSGRSSTARNTLLRFSDFPFLRQHI